MRRSVGGENFFSQYFNIENRLDRVTGIRTAFYYDADNVLTKKAITNGQAVTTTIYAGGLYEVERVGTGTPKVTRYTMLGGKRVAMRVSGSSLPAENVTTYLHGDHLGSASLATSDAGAVVSALRYTPYGAPRDGSLPTDRRYTGQREEAGIGLYDYGARFYDPELGRFISADTIVPDPASGQGYNRYAYVNNNPMKFTDPSGHRTCSAEEAANGDETCSQNYSEENLDEDESFWLIRAEALEYFWNNFDFPYQGEFPLTSSQGPDHPDGVDWAGEFTVFAPAPGRVTSAGLDSPAGIWRLRNISTGEIKEWAGYNALTIRDIGPDGLLEPERLLQSGEWIDAEPGWSHDRGTIINIDHGHQLQTRYYHVIIDPEISENLYVNRGEVLGETANIGWSTGPHLHYGVLFSFQGYKEWLNPLGRPVVSRSSLVD